MDPSIAKSIRRQNQKRVKRMDATGSQSRPKARPAAAAASGGS